MVRLSKNPDRGAAAVEFALISVILIPMLILIIEGGRLWMVQASLASAARDGAREMAINNELGDARTRVQESFLFGSIDPDDINPSPSSGCPDDPGPLDHIQIDARFDAGLLTGLFGSSVPLHGVGVMRCSG